MKHNKFTKATSIVMSAVVSAMAMGHSVCAVQTDRTTAAKIIDSAKATTPKEWAMLGIGTGIGLAALAVFATVNHFTALDKIESLADHIVAVTEQSQDAHILALKINNYTDHNGKSKPAIVVYCDNDEVKDILTQKVSPKQTADAATATYATPFAFNKILDDNKETNTQLKQLIQYLQKYHFVTLKPATIHFLTRLNCQNFDDRTFAENLFKFAYSVSKPLTQPVCNDDTEADDEDKQPLPQKTFVLAAKLTHDVAKSAAKKGSRVNVVLTDAHNNTIQTEAELATESTDDLTKDAIVKIQVATTTYKETDEQYTITFTNGDVTITVPATEQLTSDEDITDDEN